MLSMYDNTEVLSRCLQCAVSTDDTLDWCSVGVLQIPTIFASTWFNQVLFPEPMNTITLSKQFVHDQFYTGRGMFD